MLLLLLLLQADIAHAQPQPSGCQVCATNGDCSHAFHNQVGKFCGTFLSAATHTSKPCCCPVEAACKVAPSDCRCHLDSYYNNQHHNNNNNNYDPHFQKVSSMGALVVFALAVACCLCCFKSRGTNQEYPYQKAAFQPDDEITPMMPPPSLNPNFNTTSSYGATAPYPTAIPVANAYTSSYHHPGSTVNTGGGMSNWLSGLGGLAVGTALGSAFGGGGGGGHRRENEDYYHDNEYRGGGGGYDIAGDSSGGGYDIAGDTGGNDNYGGGGYDIAGDS